MKKWFVFCLILCFSYAIHAENPPLRVAITTFSPPFIMRSANQNFYGFDIEIIEYVCQKLERRCEYVPMNFDELLPSIQAQKADVAIGGIIITVKRSHLVGFSMPYMVSQAQFIGTDKSNIKPPFHLDQLDGKKIGVLTDGAFARSVRFMDIKKPKLIPFKQDNSIIHALNNNQISLALLNLPKARYWSSNSDGAFKNVGEPFPIGFGFAIAINPEEIALTKKINLALLDYQNSDEFKKNYDLYIKSNLTN
ncbi:MAG: transporter substrate-binding domain-containing protein [Legionella sp.]|nr:transporter substrate-binding domain-containing protein [Legionella sp.]